MNTMLGWGWEWGVERKLGVLQPRASLDFLLPNKERSSSHFDLVRDISKITSKKFRVQESGTIEENQRRARDSQWLARGKIKEARRQNELHQRVRKKKITLLQAYQRE